MKILFKSSIVLVGTALFAFLALSQDNPASSPLKQARISLAGDNSIREVKPCIQDGPSLQDTADYLNGWGLSWDINKGMMYQSRGPGWSYRWPIMAVSCQTYARDEEMRSYFDISCKAGNCVANHWDCQLGNYLPSHPCEPFDTMRNFFEFRLGNYDPEKADRLARALSHLLFLLQEQYKLNNSNPNDPFSKR